MRRCQTAQKSAYCLRPDSKPHESRSLWMERFIPHQFIEIVVVVVFLVWVICDSTLESLAKIIANNSWIKSVAALSSGIFLITNTSFSFWIVVSMVKPALFPIFARFDRISHILIVAAPVTSVVLLDLRVPVPPVPAGCCICCRCDDLSVSHLYADSAAHVVS